MKIQRIREEGVSKEQVHMEAFLRRSTATWRPGHGVGILFTIFATIPARTIPKMIPSDNVEQRDVGRQAMSDLCFQQIPTASSNWKTREICACNLHYVLLFQALHIPGAIYGLFIVLFVL